jgi:hypothetical protein
MIGKSGHRAPSGKVQITAEFAVSVKIGVAQ